MEYPQRSPRPISHAQKRTITNLCCQVGRQVPPHCDSLTFQEAATLIDRLIYDFASDHAIRDEDHEG